ncbi:MAG: response regulator transcription factor [Betaproteobacteria bacterium]|nr:response regulator transcription factor [Betaproteobacteria bacterium]
MKLLVIEDSPEVRQRLCQMLAALPKLNVVAIATLAAGLEKLREDPPDLVILDLQLADGDGMKMLRIAKREFPATRVFVLTNHVFRRQLCLKEGADRFFDKSMEFGVLLEAVKGLAR